MKYVTTMTREDAAQSIQVVWYTETPRAWPVLPLELEIDYLLNAEIYGTTIHVVQP